MMMNQATKFQGEPDAFGFDSLGSYGVSSDAFSFLDMNSDDLSAKGNGGLRQMYNYSSIQRTAGGARDQAFLPRETKHWRHNLSKSSKDVRGQSIS